MKLALQAHPTTEIARTIYLFDRMLMLSHYPLPERSCTGSPAPARPREGALGTGKETPPRPPDAINNYLVSRGIKVEELASGT
ncbi:MAG: hypothetical protein AB1446_01420 [Bacillota bacterium]